MAKANKVSDILRSNNKASSSKKKSDIPEIVGSEKVADKIVAAYEAFRQAETEFRAVESEILPLAQQEYESRATSGEFTKSLDFTGSKTPGLQVTFQDKFTNIPLEVEGELKQAVGKDYDKFFEEKRDLKLVDTSDATIELLVSKLGKATFEKIFAIGVSITTKGDMDRNQFSLPEQARALIKQYKGSVKPRK